MHEHSLPVEPTPLEKVTFVAFDTETTGLNPKKGHVVEIGAVKFRGNRIVGRKSWLINPNAPIPEDVQKIHGITPEMVAGCPPFPDVFPEFAKFAEGAVLLAHNAPFDMRFISEELSRAGVSPPPNMIIDTLPLFRKWFPNRSSYSLEALSAATPGLPARSLHRGLGDAMAVRDLFMMGAKSRLPPNATVNDLIESSNGVMRFRQE